MWAIDWKHLPKAALLVAGAVLLGSMIVKSNSVDALLSRNHPAAAAGFAPDDPEVVFDLAMSEFRRNGGVISASRTSAAAEALQKAPLAEDPFLVAGLAALARRDEDRAERLLTEARHRNPRSRTSRLFLLDQYLRSGQVDEAAVEAAALARLIPAAKQVLIPELARFGLDPRTRDSLARVLRSDPQMREDVLHHLATTTANPEPVLRLAAGSATAVRPPEPRPWQRALIDSLVTKGEVRRAHELWARFGGVAPPAGAKGVYDPHFQGLPGSPPFNWDFVISPAGVAEISRGQGIEVEYYGRAGAVLAAQLLRLDPGRYRLAFRAEGDAPGDGSKVAWKLECLSSKREIASLPVEGVTFAGKVVAGAFTVPEEQCSAQWLRLVGQPAEFPSAQSLMITDVQIRRVGAQ